METERLILKHYAHKDKADLLALFTDAEVMKHVGDGVLTESQTEAWWRKLFEKLYPQGFNIWAVFEKENLQYVGHAGIYPRQVKTEDWELVYFLRRTDWGKGYATELARRIIVYGLEELNLPEVYATVDDEHSVSIRVLEKAGMKFERFEFDYDGRFSIYSINKFNAKAQSR